MHIRISGTIRTSDRRWVRSKSTLTPFDHKIDCRKIEGLPGGRYVVKSFTVEDNVITIIVEQPSGRGDISITADRQSIRVKISDVIGATIPALSDGVITHLLVEVLRTKGDMVELSDHLKEVGY